MMSRLGLYAAREGARTCNTNVWRRICDKYYIQHRRSADEKPLIADTDPQNSLEQPPTGGKYLGSDPISTYYIFTNYDSIKPSDFKFGMQLGFVKANHKITPRGKSERGPGVENLHKIGGSPLIYRLKIATSNLVCGLGFPRPIIKSHPEESGRASRYGSTQIFVVSL